VAHRRAGKTVALINDLIDASLRCTLPSPRHAYVAPYFAQAKDVAWGYLKRYTANIPGARTHEGELRVDLPGDRRVRLYGADNYERLRGIYLDGVVLDEYGDMDPRAWSDVIRATLADRQGWAAFAGTPKGLNHFAELCERAQHDPDWTFLRLRASETRILPQSELDAARREMSQDRYDAEFECSFEASMVGAYFGREMRQADAEGRICRVPIEPGVAVDTWWDLGIRDAMAIWFTQTIGREVRCIDYLENSGEGLPWYAKALQERGYVYGTHNAPHDIAVKELGTGRSRLDVAADLGIRFVAVPRVADKADSIEAARTFLAKVWFDRERTERGRLALVSYHKTWDERRKVFASAPEHDWASNGSDAFQQLAMGHRFATPKKPAVAAPRRMMQAGGGAGTSWMGG
jgi:hypothetical protein